MKVILLLTISNVFMTFAWYGHLKFKDLAIWKIVLIAWAIAFIEYCFMIPANRIGYGQFNATELKLIQEIISLIVFTFFSIYYLHEHFRWNYIVGFCFIVLSVFFIFNKWN